MAQRHPITGLLAILLCAPAFAQQAPTGAEADRTVSYYYSDATRPVLMDLRVCADVQDEGEARHECTRTIDPAALTEGQEVVLWMKFLVPREASPRILMQADHEGITRDTFERTLSGAIRYRTWNRVELSRDGTWQVRVFHETEDTVRELYSDTLEVAPATSGGGTGDKDSPSE